MEVAFAIAMIVFAAAVLPDHAFLFAAYPLYIFADIFAGVGAQTLRDDADANGQYYDPPKAVKDFTKWLIKLFGWVSKFVDNVFNPPPPQPKPRVRRKL